MQVTRSTAMPTENLTLSTTDHSERECKTAFLYIFRRLAAYRNTTELYALTEAALLQSDTSGCYDDITTLEFSQALNTWGQSLLENAWVACQEPGGGGECIVYLTG